MAAMAVGKSAPVAPMSAWAAITVATCGEWRIKRQPVATATAAPTISSRFPRARSVSAPAGVCPSTDAMSIADMASPMCAGSQCRLARR